MESLLDDEMSDDKPEEDVGDPDETVLRVRINYNSGAFIESWFKTFEVTRHQPTNEIISIHWELPDVAPEAKGKLNRPISMGIEDIEAIWIVETMTATQLYSKSIGA